MFLVVIGLFWNQNNINPNIWIKITGIAVFFFGMMNVGAAHSDWLTFFSTPTLQSLSTSSLSVAV